MFYKGINKNINNKHKHRKILNIMNLSGVVRILFRDKAKYKHISDEEKSSAFFIINRRMAKYSTFNAEALNRKGMDMSMGLDIWYMFCSGHTNVPFDFWDGLKNLSRKKDILDGMTEKDKYIITNYFKQEYDEYINDINKKEDTIVKKKVPKRKTKKK